MAITKPTRSMLSTGISDSSDATFLTADSSENATFAGNLTVSGNLTVTGTTTQVDTVTMNAQNAVLFEGATADAHETTLTTVDPTGDRTISLPNVSGTLPVLAAASATAITSTPAELNIMDGGTSATSITVVDADRFVLNDNGTMLQVAASAVKSYIGSFDADAAQVFNESGAAVDFRIEGDTEQNLFFVDGSADKIGIGTSSPASNLHVETNTHANIRIQAGANSSASLRLRNDAHDWDVNCQTNDNFAIYSHTLSAETLVVNASTGNVGIGTSSPGATLHINTSTNSPMIVESTHGDGGYIELQLSDSGGAGSLTGYIGSSEALISGGAAADLAIRAQGKFEVSTGGNSKRMSIFTDGSGQFYGSWSLEDNKKLQLGASADLQLWHDGSDSYIKDNGTGNLLIQYSDLYFGDGTNHDVVFRDTGHVLLGRTSPVNDSNGVGNPPLQIENAAPGIHFYGTNTSNYSHSGGISFGSAESGGDNSWFYIYSHDENFHIYNNNSRAAYFPQGSTATWQYGSDRRLKENINDLTLGLDTLNNLKPRKFNWKEDGLEDIGFIAQEVQDLIPLAVSGSGLEWEDGEDQAVKEAKTLKIANDKLIPVLVKAVQELSQKVADQAGLIGALETRIETIEQRLI